MWAADQEVPVAGSNLDTARAIEETFARGDMEGLLSLVDEDVEWITGAWVTGTPSYHGRDGVRRWWRELEELREVQNEEVRVAFERDEELPDGRVLRLGTTTISRPQGDLVEDFGVIFSFREGKVTEMRAYMDRPLALREAGLEA
jgi:ketosteroid isomerase-like protein